MQLYQACLKKDDLVGQVTAKKLSLRDAFKVWHSNLDDLSYYLTEPIKAQNSRAIMLEI